MKACESYETHISALLDGEVARGDVLFILAHLPSCRSCQSFYSETRALQAIADSMPTAALEERDAPGVTSPPLSTRRLVPTAWAQPTRWVWGIAAGMILVVGLWLGQAQLRPSRAPSGNAVVEVMLEEHKGKMSESRFLEMAIELLEADRRLQHQMLELLQHVERSRFVEEGSVDLAANHGELPDWSEGPNGVSAARDERLLDFGAENAARD
jgi:hypothetical protein